MAESAGLCRRSKEEIALRPLFSRKDKLAFMSALVFSAGSLLIHGESVAVALSTRNETLAKSIKTLAESLTGRACRIARKGNTKEIVIENALTLLCDCHVLGGTAGGITVCEHIDTAFTSDQSAAAAYVRGAYLGAGSLSEKKYHLEFSFGKRTLAEDFAGLLGQFGVAAKVAVRKERALVYAKDSQSISDCLALMGAAKAVLDLNALLAARQMSEHLNRQQNCDMYNIDKQVDASMRQCAFLRELDPQLLSAPLYAAAQARLTYPEYSYEQLAECLGVSKSGLKNRLRRLRELYEKQTGKSLQNDGKEKDTIPVKKPPQADKNSVREDKMVFKETKVAKEFSHTDAQKFVSGCMRFDSEITLEMGSKKINAKSLMGVISMAFRSGDSVTVITKGDDQEEALETAIRMLAKS